MFTPGRSRRRMIAWAASLTAMSVVQAAFAGRSVQVDRVSRGTATFSTSGSLTTITASNRAVINYTQFDIANGQTVKFVQPTTRSRVLNRIVSNAPSMLDGTLLANGIVYFVNPAGVMFGPHSIVSVSGIIAAAGNITDNDFAAGVDHFSGSAAVVNNGTITGNSVQLVGQTVANHGTINAQGGLVAMVAGQDVLLGNGSNILVKIGTTNSTGGVSNDGTINAAGGSATLVSGDLYSMAMGTPSVIKANQVNVQGGSVAVSGTIDATNATGVGGTVTVTGKNVNVTAATINASGQTGGGTVLLGGNFHGAGPLENAQTISVSADSVIRADSTGSGNGGQVAVWSNQSTNFAGYISAAGAGTGKGGFAEISSKGTLVYPGSAYVGGPSGGGSVLLDPATFDIAPSTSGGSDMTGAEIAADVISSGGNYTVTATSEIFVHDTVDISSTTHTLTLDAPTIDFNQPVTINSGSPNLLGSANVATANVHNGGLIQNGIDVMSASTAIYPVVNVDPGTYAEDVNIRQGSVLAPITVMTTSAGTVTVNSLTVNFSNPVYLDGSYVASNGFTINDEVHAGLPAPMVGAAQDLTLTGPMMINNDGGGTSAGSIDSNNQNVTIITDSLAMATLAEIDNFSGTSGQGMLTIEPITASTAIGIGDATPPTAPIEIDPIDNIGADLRQVVIGSASGSGTITIGSSTFASPVTIQSPAPGGTIAINGAFHAYFGNVGYLVLKAPATAGSISITAPIDTDSPMIPVEVDGGTNLTSNITTYISAITINGDLTLAGTASLDTTNSEGTGLTAGANIYVASLSNGGGHSVALNSGTAGTITFAGNVDNVSDLTVTQSNGVSFEGTLGAGTAGNVSINGTQPAATILFDGAANILTLTTGGSTLGYTVAFNQSTGGQTSTIQTASLANTSGINLGNDTADSITFTNGLDYQVGSTTAIGSVSTTGTANIDLAATTLSGNTTFTAGTTTFHGSITGNEALTIDGNSAFDGSIPTFTSLLVTGTTLLTPASVTTTGSQEYDGLVTLNAGAAESFNGTTITFGGGLTGDGNNVTINANGSFGAVGSVAQLQVNGNAAFTDTVSVGSVTITGTTSVGAGAITTSGNQDYQGAVTLDADGQFISNSNGNITFAGTIDSLSSTPNSLFTETAGLTAFDGDIGDTHPISGLQTAPFGSVQLGAGGVSSTISVTASSNGEILFNFPVTLAANTTITAGMVIFSGTLDSDSASTPRDLTITAAAGMLDFTGPFTAESLTAGAADVSFASTGQTYSLGNVFINPSTSSPSAAIDLNNSPLDISSATFSGPVILTSDLTINATGNVDFQLTIDSDSSSTERSLTINTPGTTTFGGDIGDTHPLSSLTSSATGTTDINGSAITTAGTQTFNNPVALGALVTLKGTTINFNSTIAGNSHDLTVNSTNTIFDGAVTGIGTLQVVNAANINADITSTGSQSYGAATLGADVTLTGGGLTFASITGNSFGLTLAAGSTPISISGDTSVGQLTIASNAGATFAGTVSANAFTIDDSQASATITFDDAVTIGTFTASGTANTYNIAFNNGASGQTSTITTGALANTGSLTLGNDIADAITFTNGLTHTAGPTSLSGTLTATNAPISLGALSVQTSSSIDAGSGAITLSYTTIAAGDTLTLGTGNSGPITASSLAGASSTTASNVIFNTTGAVSVSGYVGPNIGNLTITNSGGATFGGDVTVDTLNLTATSGTIAFNGDLTAATLNDTGGNFNLQFLSSATISNPVTLATTGTVTLGGGITLDDVLNNTNAILKFRGGITHIAGPNVLNGDVEAAAAINLSSATSVTGYSILISGIGDTNVGDLTIADGRNFDVGFKPSSGVGPGVTSTGLAIFYNPPVVQAGDITLASVAGGTSSTISLGTSGNVSIPGAVGSAAAPIGDIYIPASRTDTFGGAINTSGDISISATNSASDPGSGELVFHGDLTAGGNITLSPGSTLVPIGNIANANATGTITFYSNNITAGGNLALISSPILFAEPLITSSGGNYPSVANIIALDTPTTVNGFTGIALNINANTLNMGTNANLSSPAGGVAISLGTGTSTIGSITAGGSIDISAASGAKINVVDRGSWMALTSTGTLLREHGTVLFAGGQGQPDIISTPTGMQANGSLTKFALTFATQNAKAGRAHKLKTTQLVSAAQLQYATGGTTYYLMNPVPTSSGQSVSGDIVPPQLNQFYIQENIDFDSAMRKQFWQFGLYGRDTTLDTVDGGIVRPPQPSANDWSDVTLSLVTPTTNP